jgi:hypothetical protein
MNTQIIKQQGSKMNSRFLCLVMLLALLLAGCGKQTGTAAPLNASDSDLEAIRQTASDYIDGWYTGDVARMDRSLYDQLSKRWISYDQVETTTKSEMLEMTKTGGGKNYAGDKKSTVTILDVYGNIAMVKTVSAEYIDYIQMGKVNGKWIIINVLWTNKNSE